MSCDDEKDPESELDLDDWEELDEEEDDPEPIRDLPVYDEDGVEIPPEEMPRLDEEEADPSDDSHDWEYDDSDDEDDDDDESDDDDDDDDESDADEEEENWENEIPGHHQRRAKPKPQPS